MKSAYKFVSLDHIEGKTIRRVDHSTDKGLVLVFADDTYVNIVAVSNWGGPEIDNTEIRLGYDFEHLSESDLIRLGFFTDAQVRDFRLAEQKKQSEFQRARDLEQYHRLKDKLGITS